MDIFNYSRRETSEVNIGATPMGGSNPTRMQNTTSTSTQDTDAYVTQAKHIVDADGKYVHLTTQGVKGTENLMNISTTLRQDGYMVLLVADVHFNPKVADVAAQYTEKVHINPNNYVDAAHTLKHLEYTDGEYAQEVWEIRDRLIPFLNICKTNHTAICIGVNHDSSSDRITSRYGDTPEDMIESCMKFLRICVAGKFMDVVISIKASNMVIMVKTIRLLTHIMERGGMHFPLHPGITEAGDREDGRIKSTLGVSTLLADGLGDTVRVPLDEAPGAETPVAGKLVGYMTQRRSHPYIPGAVASEFHYLSPKRRTTTATHNIDGENLSVVVIVRLDGNMDFNPQFTPDYVYVGHQLPEHSIKGIQCIIDADPWNGQPGIWSAFESEQLPFVSEFNASLRFLFINYMGLDDEAIACLKYHPEIVLVAQSIHPNRLDEYRALVYQLMNEGLKNPLVFFQHYAEDEVEDLQIRSATDMGTPIIDGLCDGVLLFSQNRQKDDEKISDKVTDVITFDILRVGRARTSKTEYVSCLGCGHILYDLESTIARIEWATSCLKGLKIGIMDCVVSGPGEVADADYGYINAGRDEISLYKRRECIEKDISGEEAVEKLIRLIKKNGDYTER